MTVHLRIIIDTSKIILLQLEFLRKQFTPLFDSTSVRPYSKVNWVLFTQDKPIQRGQTCFHSDLTN